MGKALELRGVSKAYRRGGHVVSALRDASFALEEGGVAFVSGPSGSGKSTLLLLAGLMDMPDSGDVALRGRSMARAPEREREEARLRGIGFVFQQSYLVPSLTAAGNVALPLKAAGVPDEERARRVAALLERVSLGERAEHYPHELSGGQQQLVAVARALANRPFLVLADEPTAGLDPASAARVMGLLSRASREENAAVVVVSHAREELPGAKRYRLADGRLEAEP